MKERKITIYQITFMALMAAVTCILAPLSIAIGPVPITLTNLVVFFSVCVLGTKAGTGSYCLYVLLGTVGLPVFSGYAGGIGKLAGPTGGYIVGFIFMALIGGAIMEKFNRKLIPTIIGWIIGMIVDYAMGTLWFAYTAHCSVGYALTICVVPFIAGDLVKIVIGTLLAREVRIGLAKAHVVAAN